MSGLLVLTVVIPAEAGIQDGGVPPHPFGLRYRSLVPLSRWRSCSLREAASGCAPDRAVPFLCFAKEKEPKERRPSSPVGLGPTALRCSVFAARAELATRPAAAALRQLREVRLGGALARPAAKPCAARRLRRGPKSNTVVASQLSLSTPRFASARAERRDISPTRSEVGWCLSPPSDELSSTGLCGARGSAHPRLTSRRLFERSERSERSEFGAAAKTEQRKAALAQRGPRRLGSLLCLLSCRYKKGGRPPGRTPGAASRSEQEPRANSATSTTLRYLSPNGWSTAT
jgi:hypothetical protein